MLQATTNGEEDCQEFQDAVDALELMLQDTELALQLAQQDLEDCLNG